MPPLAVSTFFLVFGWRSFAARFDGVQKYLLIWAGKYEKEWAKFGLGISIILRRRTESMRTGVTHVRTQLPKLSEKKNTHAWLACFLPARPNEYFCEKKREGGNNREASEQKAMEDIIWRETRY